LSGNEKARTPRVISIRNLTKAFDGKVALNRLNLEIQKGEFFSLLGPNGAGKTTAIKLMTGLLRPTEGMVLVGGHNLASEHVEAKRLMSYVPDQPYLYDKLSGREFLWFVGKVYGMSRTQIDKEVAQWTDVFEMHDYIDDLTESYSHGMKQRVVVSSALMHGPRVIVVDEPMVGLDPKSSYLLKAILRERAEQGVTVFMSTHILTNAEEMASRIGILHKGSLIALGSLQEIRDLSHTEGRLEEAFLALTGETAT